MVQAGLELLLVLALLLNARLIDRHVPSQHVTSHGKCLMRSLRESVITKCMPTLKVIEVNCCPVFILLLGTLTKMLTLWKQAGDMDGS